MNSIVRYGKLYSIKDLDGTKTINENKFNLLQYSQLNYLGFGEEIFHRSKTAYEDYFFNTVRTKLCAGYQVMLPDDIADEFANTNAEHKKRKRSNSDTGDKSNTKQKKKMKMKTK